MFSCEVCETFKNTYFEEHLRATPFIIGVNNAEGELVAVLTIQKTLEKTSRSPTRWDFHEIFREDIFS